jgi:hypothetical protein
MRKHLSCLALLFVLLLPAASEGAVLVSNSAGTGDYGGLPLKFMSQTFTTDSQTWSNLNITLALANYNTTSSGSFSVGIYADNAGSIGSLIGGLTTSNSAFFTNPNGKDWGSLNLADFQNILFENNAITLSANTTYWVALNNDTRSNFTWNSYASALISGLGSYGLAWLGNSSASVSDGGGNLFAMSVTGTAVPEPSTYALFGLGALALVVAYRRKVA